MTTQRRQKIASRSCHEGANSLETGTRLEEGSTSSNVAAIKIKDWGIHRNFQNLGVAANKTKNIWGVWEFVKETLRPMGKQQILKPKKKKIVWKEKIFF